MSKKFFSRLVYLALFFFVASVSAAWTVNFLVKAGDAVEMPDLVGKTTLEAEQALSIKKLILDIQGSQYSETYSEGTILHQLIPVGEWVRSGRKVGVLLSKGLRERAAPRVAGLDQQAAKLVLNSSDLELTVMAKACDESIPADHVIAQDPPPGMWMGGRQLKTLISTGNCTNRFVMPDVRGVELRGFLSDLDRKGFVVRFFQYEKNDNVPSGTILSIHPEPGTIVRNTEALTIKVNNAPKLAPAEDFSGAHMVYILIHSPPGLFGKPARLQFQRGVSDEDDSIDFFLTPGENTGFVAWMPAKAEAIFSLDGHTMWRKEY